MIDQRARESCVAEQTVQVFSSRRAARGGRRQFLQDVPLRFLQRGGRKEFRRRQHFAAISHERGVADERRRSIRWICELRQGRADIRFGNRNRLVETTVDGAVFLQSPAHDHATDHDCRAAHHQPASPTCPRRPLDRGVENFHFRHLAQRAFGNDGVAGSKSPPRFADSGGHQVFKLAGFSWVASVHRTQIRRIGIAAARTDASLPVQQNG